MRRLSLCRRSERKGRGLRVSCRGLRRAEALAFRLVELNRRLSMLHDHKNSLPDLFLCFLTKHYPSCSTSRCVKVRGQRKAR